MLWERDRTDHGQLRRDWNKAFNSTSLKDYDAMVVRTSRELVEELEKRTSEVVDISKWMDYFSLVISVIV